MEGAEGLWELLQHVYEHDRLPRQSNVNSQRFR